MKKFNKNPIVWWLVTMILGWWATETGNFEFFVVSVSAIILAKQIEILLK